MRFHWMSRIGTLVLCCPICGEAVPPETPEPFEVLESTFAALGRSGADVPNAAAVAQREGLISGRGGPPVSER